MCLCAGCGLQPEQADLDACAGIHLNGNSAATGAHPDADVYTYANAFPDANAHADADVYRYANAFPDADANVLPNAYPGDGGFVDNHTDVYRNDPGDLG